LHIDCLLKRDENGVEVRSESANNVNETSKLSENGIVKIIAEHKRLTYHKPAVTFLFCILEKPSVCRFIFVGKDSARQFTGFEPPPDVVYADENA